MARSTAPVKLVSGPATADWPVWSTLARIVVTEPELLPLARRLVETELHAVDLACSRFRDDSELSQLVQAGDGRPVEVSPLLAELVAVALEAARASDGDVDPTIGGALAALGYDTDLYALPDIGPPVRLVVRSAPGWQRIHLDGRRLTVPAGVAPDLGASAKAHTADRCAELVARRYDVGVLVSLGGDIATAGPAPAGGWRVLVQDRPDDPACVIALPGGAALATSSSVSRRWRRGDRTLHHILDPRTCQPAAPVWRTVSVAAARCADANTLTTAAMVRGQAALPWLRRLGMPARLVTAGGEVITLNGWPTPADGTQP
jgi:thiamine biosynthesis lipoprotein